MDLSFLKYDENWSAEEKAMFDELVKEEMDRIESELKEPLPITHNAPKVTKNHGVLISSEEWNRGKQLVNEQHSPEKVYSSRQVKNYNSDPSDDLLPHSISNRNSNSNNDHAVDIKRQQQQKYHDELTAAANAPAIDTGRSTLYRRRNQSPPGQQSSISMPSYANNNDNNHSSGRVLSDDRLQKREQQRKYYEELSSASAQPAIATERVALHNRRRRNDDPDYQDNNNNNNNNAGNDSYRYPQPPVQNQARNPPAMSGSGPMFGQSASGKETEVANKRLAQQEYYRQLQEDENRNVVLPLRVSRAAARRSSPYDATTEQQQYSNQGSVSNKLANSFGDLSVNANSSHQQSSRRPDSSEKTNRREMQREYARALQDDMERNKCHKEENSVAGGMSGGRARSGGRRRPTDLQANEDGQDYDTSYQQRGQLAHDNSFKSKGTGNLMEQLTNGQDNHAANNREKQRQYAEALARDQASGPIQASRGTLRNRQTSPPNSGGPSRAVGAAGAISFLGGAPHSQPHQQQQQQHQQQHQQQQQYSQQYGQQPSGSMSAKPSNPASNDVTRQEPGYQYIQSSSRESRRPNNASLQYENDSSQRNDPRYDAHAAVSAPVVARQVSDRNQDDDDDDDDEEAKYQAYAAEMRRKMQAQQYAQRDEEEYPPSNQSLQQPKSYSQPQVSQPPPQYGSDKNRAGGGVGAVAGVSRGGGGGADYRDRGNSSGGGVTNWRLG